MHYKLPNGNVESSLLLVLPSFRRTRQVVLVNTRTLVSEVISFQSLVSDDTLDESMGKKHAAMKLKKKRVDDDDAFAIDYSDAVDLDI